MHLDIGFLEPHLPLLRRQTQGGGLWLIGGQVYRRLAWNMYGGPEPVIRDVDILVESPKPWRELDLPSDWTLERTGPGEPRFLFPGGQVDFVALDHAINPWEASDFGQMSTRDKLESYFRRVPLTIQALACSLESGEVLGEVGKRALISRTVEIHNPQECGTACQRRKTESRAYCERIRQSVFGS